MKKTIVLAIAVLILAGCRPYEEDGGNTASVSPDIGAALPLQYASAVGTPYVGTTAVELGVLAEVPQTVTADEVVSTPDFDFSTSRKVAITFDVEQARGLTADVTICSEYLKTSIGYNVKYDSCMLESKMVDGRLTETLDVVNQYDRLLGIVWLPDENSEPIYREYLIN